MPARQLSRELGITGAGAPNVIRKLEEGLAARGTGDWEGGRITWIATDILTVLMGVLDDDPTSA